MDVGLTDRRVLVTGATGGIGRALTRAFAAEGARVAVAYHRDHAAAQASVAEWGGAQRALAVRYDLTDPACGDGAVGAVTARWGGLDVLVANAIRPPTFRPGASPFEDVPVADWLPFVQDNLVQTVATVQAAVGAMRRGGWGRIVLVSTHLVRQGAAGREFYTATKAALHGLASSLAWDVGRDGILVNVVAPGLTLTDRVAAMPQEVRAREVAATPSGRLSTPAEVAHAVLFLGSALNGNITGEVLTVAGGH